MEDYAFIFMVDLCISHLPPFTDMSQRGKSEENPIMGHSPPPLFTDASWVEDLKKIPLQVTCTVCTTFN